MSNELADFSRDLAQALERFIDRKMDEKFQAHIRFAQTFSQAPHGKAGPKNLTEEEVAARLRSTKSTLQKWRRDPEHPLKWFKPSGKPGQRGGRVLYTLESVEAFEEYCQT